MQKFIAVLTNPSVRRIVVFLLGFLTIALNKKLGLDLDPNAMLTDALLVLGYVGQAAYTDASKSRSDAMLAAAEAHADAAKPAIPPPAPTAPAGP